MGTTLTIAYVVWPRLYIVHVGDSRAYLLRDTHFEQITTDHTLAQQSVESGHLSESEARTSRLSHVLWNALGDESYAVQPEIHKATLQLGDKLLVCTDGLTRHVHDHDIRQLLQQDKPAKALCEELIDAANRAGGFDNITAIVAQFQESGHAAEELLKEAVDATTQRSNPTQDVTQLEESEAQIEKNLAVEQEA